MFECDWCHKKEPEMLLFKWHNGIVLVEKWYCKFCVKHGFSPPPREVPHELRNLLMDRQYLLTRVKRLEALQHAAKNVLDVSIATTAAVGGSPHVTSEGKLRIADALIALRNAVEALEADDGDA